MIEVSVRVSNEEAKFTKKFAIYDEKIVISQDDPRLKEIVQNTIDSFKGNVDDVFVTIKMSW